MKDRDLIMILRTRITSADSAEPHVTVTCTLRLLPEMGGQDNAWPLAGLYPLPTTSESS